MKRSHPHSNEPQRGTQGLGLFDAMPAGSSVNSDTSEAAADEIQASGRLATLRRTVLQMFAAAGEKGLTADECVAMYGDGTDTNAIAPRVTELHGMNYLTRTGLRVLTGPRKGAEVFATRKTRKGSNAFVLIITSSGSKALRREIVSQGHTPDEASRILNGTTPKCAVFSPSDAPTEDKT